MTNLLKSLLECEQEGFSALDRSAKRCGCFSTLLSYCYDIPELKGTSTVLHGSAVFRLYVRCLSTATDTRHHRYSEPTNVEQTKAVRVCTKEKFIKAKNSVKKEVK